MFYIPLSHSQRHANILVRSVYTRLPSVPQYPSSIAMLVLMILFLIEIYLYQIVDIILCITLTLHNIRISGSHHFYPGPFHPKRYLFCLCSSLIPAQMVYSANMPSHGRCVWYLHCQSCLADKAIDGELYRLLLNGNYRVTKKKQGCLRHILVIGSKWSTKVDTFTYYLIWSHYFINIFKIFQLKSIRYLNLS